MKVAVVIALVALVAPVWAKGDKAKPKDDDEDTSDDGSDDDTDADAPKSKAKPKAKSSDDDEGSDQAKPAKDAEPAADEPKKQDLTGHDLGTKKKATEFEKDRFFVDKADTEQTENGTLVQGSLTATTFLYGEAGGNYALVNAGTTPGPGSDAGPARYFGDLRLQTDFRHIKASRWEGRFDGRIRVVNTPPSNIGILPPSAANPTGTVQAPPTHSQSGLTGGNEYEIRELWLIRNGERTDVIIGRQFIPDLGAIKIDGVRIDYAKSNKFTLLGFAGLYPLRGSRSITTDYITQYSDLNAAGQHTAVGKFVGAGGFGAAYRTVNAYGSFGGVVLAPLQAEAPRVYATSTGYLRTGPNLDVYHFALIDLVGSQGFQLTNVSAGLNYKPNQRLRVTANVNRVDVDTLNVQANAFFNSLDNQTTGGNLVIQNQAYLIRLATNEARVGVSAGLGPMQRFELSTALTYRLRPSFTLYGPAVTAPAVQAKAQIDAAQSAEVWAGLTDRHSIAGMRLGVDVSRTFGVGTIPYQRNETLGVRAFGSRELASGHGEWEAEIAYASVKDNISGMSCAAATDVATCFGASAGTIISVGGQLYYRFNRDWLGIGSAYLSRIDNQAKTGTMTTTTDPTVTALTGFARAAYRF